MLASAPKSGLMCRVGGVFPHTNLSVLAVFKHYCLKIWMSVLLAPYRKE